MSIHGPAITIANLADTVSVTLTGQNAPHPIPEIKRPYLIDEAITRGGYRTLQLAGTNETLGTIEFPVKLLSDDQVEALDGLYNAQPASRLKFTLDGTVWHRAVFDRDGWEKRPWKAPHWAKRSGFIKLLVTGVLDA